MSSQVNESTLRQQLTSLSYQNIDQTIRQIMQTLAQHHTLSTSEDNFMDSSTNYDPCRLLKLGGTIAIFYKNQTYHIPVEFYLPKVFPSWPLVGYVRPTSNMKLVQPHKSVGSDGKIYCKYISDWASSKGAGRENLSDCLKQICSVFSQKPPVCATTTSMPSMQRVQSQVQQSQPQGPGQYQPYGSYGSVAGPPGASGYQPPAAGPGYPTNIAGPGYPAQPWAMPTAGGNGPYPNFQTNSGPPMPAYGSGHRQPGPPARPQPPSQDNERAKKMSLITNVNSLLQENSKPNITELTNEINQMTTVLSQLNSNKEAIESKLATIEQECKKISDANSQLEAEIAVKGPEVEAMEGGEEDVIDVDELILPKTPLERQIFKNHSEDLAIQDLLYELGQGLRKDIIDSSTFTKEVRKLGRKQFKLRAQIKKARKVAGLSAV